MVNNIVRLSLVYTTKMTRQKENQIFNCRSRADPGASVAQISGLILGQSKSLYSSIFLKYSLSSLGLWVTGV